MHLSLARAAETFCDACYTFLFGARAEGAAVPLYEYKCLKCGRHTEKIEPVAGPHVKKCPHCGGKVESVITAPAIKFKGSGWYVTDYAGKSQDGGSKEKIASEGKDSGGKDSAGKDGGAKDSKDVGSKEAPSKDSAAKETSKESSSKEKKPAKKK
jgi:putative FmdB family regulatory protein